MAVTTRSQRASPRQLTRSKQQKPSPPKRKTTREAKSSKRATCAVVTPPPIETATNDMQTTTMTTTTTTTVLTRSSIAGIQPTNPTMKQNTRQTKSNSAVAIQQQKLATRPKRGQVLELQRNDVVIGATGTTNTPRPNLSAKRSPRLANVAKEAGKNIHVNETTVIAKAKTAKSPKRPSKKHARDDAIPVVPATKSAEPPKARRRLAFGRFEIAKEQEPPKENVSKMYAIVRKMTGSIGGNGSFGAIYGELTIGSMQKMIDLMKKHCGLDASSRFIDVGSGVGKPNLHVCQDPGVAFSYGIEMEKSRWLLSLSSLKGTMDEALKRNERRAAASPQAAIGTNCYFHHGNILFAKTFDPFTHVYMFSIGFPPHLWSHLAPMWNRSKAEYLICFHPPKFVIDTYGFSMELIKQTQTNMHGSGEGHMGYIYKRKPLTSDSVEEDLQQESIEGLLVDPLYKEAYQTVKEGFAVLHQCVSDRLQSEISRGRATRSRKVVYCIEAPETP